MEGGEGEDGGIILHYVNQSFLSTNHALALRTSSKTSSNAGI